jgi:hypothetical protein
MINYKGDYENIQNSIHIYMDLQIQNQDQIGNKEPVPISFIETRNNPIIQNSEDYYLSIVKFQIQTSNLLPCFIPQVSLGQVDPNLLIYSITLKYKNFIQQEFVYYIAQNLTYSTPLPPLTNQDLTTGYYYINNFQDWIEMLNNTFAEAVNNLNVKVLAGSDTLPTLNVPFVEWDPQNLIAIMNFDKNGYDRLLANPIEVYFNSPLYNLYPNFPNKFQGYKVQNGMNAKLEIYNNNNTNILQLNSYDAIQIYQEGSTISLLNPIQSIVFTSSLLPVVPSNISKPKIFNSFLPQQTSGNDANISNIISDFSVAVEPVNRYIPSVLYIPSAEYRFISLTGNNPINSVEISAFWRDLYGGLHPIFLASGMGASLKLLFRKKTFETGGIKL